MRYTQQAQTVPANQQNPTLGNNNWQQNGTQRLNELLDLVRQEFSNVASEASSYLLHKDDFDQKMHTQLSSELQQMHKMIFELEQAHKHMKDQYEEEIARLKHRLEEHVPRGPPPQTDTSGQVFNSANSQNQLPQAGYQPPVGQGQLQGVTQLPQPAPNNSAHGVNAQIPGPQLPQQPQPPSQPQPQQTEDVAPYPPAVAVNPLPTEEPRPIQDSAQPQNHNAQLGNNLASLDIEHLSPELYKQNDEFVVVYNEKAGKPLDVELEHSLVHDSVVCCVRFSADGKSLATGCNRSAQIYDVQSGTLTCQLEDENVSKDNDLYIRAVCFSPDGKYLATGAEDKLIRVWDLATKKIHHVFSGHEQDIYSLDFAQSGRYIASGSGDRTVRLWDMESGQCLRTLAIEDGVTAVVVSPNGQYVAAGSLDHMVRVWDVQTGALVELLDQVTGHKESVYSVAFAPNGQSLVSGSLDETIKVWDLSKIRGTAGVPSPGSCLRTITGHRDFVLSVATTPDGRWVLSGSKDRSVQIWDMNNGQAVLMLQAHKNSVISVVPSPQGQLFATGSGDCSAKIWRMVSTS